MRGFFILITAIFLCVKLHGQKGFAEGYYVLQQGDTVKCKVKDKLVFSSSGKKIKCISSNGKKIKLKAKNIKGYGKLNLIHFRSIPMDFGIIRFAEIISEGKLVLYRYFTVRTQTNHGRYGYGSYGTYTSTTSKFYYYIQAKDTKEIQKVTMLGFRDLIREYIKDNPELVKMTDEKSLRYADIELIIKKYNFENGLK